MTEDGSDRGDALSRRRFAKSALMATAAAAVPKRANGGAKADVGQATQQQPIPPVVEAQMAALLSKYGDRLSEEQKNECRRLLIQAHKGAEAMRAFPLENSNEPATVFRVYRAKKS